MMIRIARHDRTVCRATEHNEIRRPRLPYRLTPHLVWGALGRLPDARAEHHRQPSRSAVLPASLGLSSQCATEKISTESPDTIIPENRLGTDVFHRIFRVITKPVPLPVGNGAEKRGKACVRGIG